MTKQTVATITDDGIAELRSRIGVWRPLSSHDFNTEGCYDNIRRFAWGIGDDNPLWIDLEYARKTQWGTIIAPPCFVCTFGIPRPEKLPGVHAQFAAQDFELFEPVYLGDHIVGKSRLADVVEKKSRFAGRTVLEIKEAEYRNQENKLVSRIFYTFVRHERHTAAETGKYREVHPQTWTPETLRVIEQSYEQEERRGATPRYWDDVNLGDELQPRVKGPLTVADVIWGFIGAGGMPFSLGFGLAHKLRQKHPAMFVVNSQGAYETIASCHWDWDFASRIGAPGPYDVTTPRIACLSHMITDWMGDDGWLKRLTAQSRRFGVLGDVMWYKGKVVGKRIHDGNHVVDLEVWGENQRGEITTPGRAEVILPTREN